MLKRLIVVVCLVVLAGFTVNTNAVQAETQKIGVMNIQKIITESKAGLKARDVLEQRNKELEVKFKTEQEEIVALQKEIEKKKTVWSQDKLNEKARGFQLKQREMQVKVQDAQMEMKQLQKTELEPISKMLQQVVISFGEKNGYTLLLDSTTMGGTVLFASSAIDVSEDIKKELDVRLK